MSRRRPPSTFIAASLLLAACAGDAPDAADTGAIPADTPVTVTDDRAVAGDAVFREIDAMLQSSAASWNAGDLEGFLDDYLDSPRTVFIGSSRTYGVDEVRRRYQEGYWAEGAPPQALTFDSLAVESLGGDHALAQGRYVLTAREAPDTLATGYFTLVLVRTDAGWRIMHDHSSEAARDTAGG